MQLKIFTCTTLLVHAQKVEGHRHNKENTTQRAKYKKHSDLIPWKFVEMSNFFELLFILKFVTKKLHAQCACRLANLLAQRKKRMHLCKCACVKSSTVIIFHEMGLTVIFKSVYYIFFLKNMIFTNFVISRT